MGKSKYYSLAFSFERYERDGKADDFEMVGDEKQYEEGTLCYYCWIPRSYSGSTHQEVHEWSEQQTIRRGKESFTAMVFSKLVFSVILLMCSSRNQCHKLYYTMLTLEWSC